MGNSSRARARDADGSNRNDRKSDGGRAGRGAQGRDCRFVKLGRAERRAPSGRSSSIRSRVRTMLRVRQTRRGCRHAGALAGRVGSRGDHASQQGAHSHMHETTDLRRFQCPARLGAALLLDHRHATIRLANERRQSIRGNRHASRSAVAQRLKGRARYSIQNHRLTAGACCDQLLVVRRET